MPVVSRPVQTAREPTFWDRITMGATMGGMAGAMIGVLFGGMAIYQYGPGPRGYMRTMGQYMLGSGAMFAMFMGIGSVIRSEGPSPEQWRRSIDHHRK